MCECVWLHDDSSDMCMWVGNLGEEDVCGCACVWVSGCLGWWARGDDFMFSVVMICITDFFFSAVIPVHSYQFKCF